MFEEHELVLAARRQERIKAANPYGCNRYGHRKGHGGSSSEGSSKQSEPEKKGDNKPEEKKPQQGPKKQSVNEDIKKTPSKNEDLNKDFDAVQKRVRAYIEEHKKLIKESEEEIKKLTNHEYSDMDEFTDVSSAVATEKQTIAHYEKKNKKLEEELKWLESRKKYYEENLKIKESVDQDPEMAVGFDLEAELKTTEDHYKRSKARLLDILENTF
jgi:ATP-dependent Lon protease